MYVRKQFLSECLTLYVAIATHSIVCSYVSMYVSDYITVKAS